MKISIAEYKSKTRGKESEKSEKGEKRKPEEMEIEEKKKGPSKKVKN